ncbi:MAG TPA: hypothetical protein VGF55_20995 [Gemmataceae bacterium]|jgi:hypothetical protein
MRKRVGTAAVAAVAFVLGGVAVEQCPRVRAQGGDIKGPKWQYGLDVRVRKGGEQDFGKDTKKVGIEVFRDENNGNLIYVAEGGSIAVLPGK